MGGGGGKRGTSSEEKGEETFLTSLEGERGIKGGREGEGEEHSGERNSVRTQGKRLRSLPFGPFSPSGRREKKEGRE